MSTTVPQAYAVHTETFIINVNVVVKIFVANVQVSVNLCQVSVVLEAETFMWQVQQFSFSFM